MKIFLLTKLIFKIMKKSSKKTFKRTDIAYLLNALYYVSYAFSHKQYEIYVKATHLYFDHFTGAPLTVDDVEAFSNLYCIAYSFKDSLVSYQFDRLNSILSIYEKDK